MAKKQTTEETEASRRQSRKEVLRAQKHNEQVRIMRIAAISVGVIILLVVAVAIVNEMILMPNRSVATVNGQPVTLRDWQNRVEYERAQRIMTLESQVEAFNGDIGLVQQFSGQAIMELMSENAEAVGESVLDRLIQTEVMRQAAEERGLLPTEADVDERIAESFNYFGGASPTSTPDPTATVEPTPSITPIPAEGEEAPLEAVPTLEPLPTNEPPPTPTPVSEESFQQEFGQILTDFKDLGVDEETYRSVVRDSIIAERLMDALAEEQGLPTEDVKASIFFLAFSDETEAAQAMDDITAGDFLNVWNTIRSQSLDATADQTSTATASEVLWRTQDEYAASFGDAAATAIFEMPLDTPSVMFTITGSDGQPLYIIVQVSGREMRELSESELDARKQDLLLSFVDEQMANNVETSELWRNRVPSSPLLDPKFRQPPTPTPVTGLDGVGDTETGDGTPSP